MKLHILNDLYIEFEDFEPPVTDSVDPRYASGLLTPAYASNLEALMEVTRWRSGFAANCMSHLTARLMAGG